MQHGLHSGGKSIRFKLGCLHQLLQLQLNFDSSIFELVFGYLAGMKLGPQSTLRESGSEQMVTFL